MAASLATSLATDASCEYGRPASRSRAACRYAARAEPVAGGHVGQQELQPLELADRLAELATLPRVRDGGVECGLRQPGRAGSDTEATAVEGGQGDVHTASLVADACRPGHPNALEDDLGRGRAGQPHLALGRPEGQAVDARRHVEAADAAAALGRRTREHQIEVGLRAVRDPRLRAGEDVLVAVPHCLRGHARDVGAGLGLAQAVRAELLAAQHVRAAAPAAARAWHAALPHPLPARAR
jgi:hypothetical protein